MAKSNLCIKEICFNLNCAKPSNNIIKKLRKNKIVMQNLPKERNKKENKSNSSKNVKNFSKKEKFLLLLSGMIIGFLNGFFGGGGGIVCVPILQKVLSLDAKQSHATAIAVIFPLSLISAFIYVINGYIKSFPLITIGLGVVAGGLLGAFALKFLPPKAIRFIFALIMFVGGVKLII